MRRFASYSVNAFFPQALKHWASTSLERNKMNVPVNLLFDIEVAKSRLLEAFKPATGSDDCRKAQPASCQIEPSLTETKESAISHSFRVPEVRGCAGISFQAL
jgi:hypothetical protein